MAMCWQIQLWAAAIVGRELPEGVTRHEAHGIITRALRTAGDSPDDLP